MKTSSAHHDDTAGTVAMISTGSHRDTDTFHLLRAGREPGLSGEHAAQLRHAEADRTGKDAAILVAEDSAEIRSLTVLSLRALGYKNISEAVDGQAALDLIRQRDFDLLVLDIEMPRLDGYGVLEAVKELPFRNYLPVIVTSGLQDLDAVVRCIELGAEDFLHKPVNSVILRARVGASIERKRLRDLERLRNLELQQEKQHLEREQEKSERLLLNILPKVIAERLKQGERTIAERYDCVTVLFADLVDFTPLANRTDPAELVSLLNDLFSRFDRLSDLHGLEKIKTIGDCYLAACGLPVPRPDHAGAAAQMGLDMLASVEELNRERGTHLNLRIGLNSGPVVAGVIGRKKFTYDLWGPAVNLASRMQSSGLPGRIHLTAATGELLRDKFDLSERGMVFCKGMGEVQSCLLDRRKPSGSHSISNA